MSNAQRSRSLAEIARLGAEFFARQIRPALSPADDDNYVAIDIATGDYEVDPDDYAAVERLRSRNPLAEIWLERAGQPAAYRMRACR